MKIGIVASHIYRPDDEELSHITTGLAITVYDIIANHTLNEQILYFTTIQRVKGRKCDKVEIVDTRLGMSNLIHCFSSDTLATLISALFHSGFKEAIKQAYYSLMYKLFIKEMDKFQPDIIHFHDLCEQSIKLLEYCDKQNISCLLTLHIYIGKSKNEGIQESYQKLSLYEERAFKCKNVHISVISSGMKKRIMEDYSNLSEDRISLILDGTDGHAHDTTIDNKYDELMTSNKKILLCIGTIMKRKNQAQVLRALALCKEKLGKDCPVVLFLGSDSTDGRFESSINRLGLSKVAKYVGSVPAEEMCVFYKMAAGVISASLNEAFGLTFIEGFNYGIPSLYFSDIDSANDLFDPNAVVVVKEHTDEDFAQGIINMITREWDSDQIVRHAKGYRIENTAQEYENLYMQMEREKNGSR